MIALISRRTVLALAASALLAATGVHAQSSGPMRVILPIGAGSGVDTIMRAAQNDLSKALGGQPVVIENLPGAGGITGTSAIVKAAPDGNTIGVISNNHAVNPSVFKKIPYDSLKDITPISVVGSTPFVLVVNPAKVPAKNAKELQAFLKAKPGAYNYGTAGVGSAAHINSEKFNVAAGIKAVHVPLKGTPPILTETMAGRVHFAWVPTLSSMGLLKDGKLLALAVSTAKRTPVLPDVPTIAEAGYPGGQFDFWLGMLAPAKTPRDVVIKVNAEINRALRSSDMIERLARLGSEPMAMTPDEFDAFIAKEYEVLGKIMRDAGATPQ